jgi:hypothetical protein
VYFFFLFEDCDAALYRLLTPESLTIVACSSLPACVQEISEPGSLKSGGGVLQGVPGAPTIERTLRWGTLFGEVALATNSPYFSTTIARG